MRYIIYGAGAIGGTIGARLFLAGQDVILICRGQHLAVVRERGLRFRTPSGDHTLSIAAAGSPAEISFRTGDTVILAMKTQHTEAALGELELSAGDRVPVFCAQNGVENERLAARRFKNVYGTLVALPASHLEPGEVIASARPASGVLHSGRFPAGTDSVAEEVCATLNASGFVAEAVPDILRYKYAKLLQNLANAGDVVLGWQARTSEDALAFMREVRREALRVFAAAGIVSLTQEEYQERITRHYASVPIDGKDRAASSTLQSVLRGHTSIEVDYLNGEVALLGQLHGIPTPHNAALRLVANRMAARGEAPGSVTVEMLLDVVSGQGAHA